MAQTPLIPGQDKQAGLDFSGVVPVAEIEQATEWVASVTEMASAFFVYETEAPTGLSGGAPPVYGQHPVFERLSRANPMAAQRCHHALWHAALRAVEAGVASGADSPVGRLTVWACPLVVIHHGRVVLKGALAAFLHTHASLATAEELAETFGVPPSVAFEALEAGWRVPLNAQKVAAVKALMAALCESFSRRIAEAADAAAAQQPVGPTRQRSVTTVRRAGDGVLDRLPSLLRGQTSPRELLEATTKLFHEVFGVPHVAAWLRFPPDRCGQCAYDGVCEASEHCFHLVASVGSAADRRHERIPASMLPPELRDEAWLHTGPLWRRRYEGPLGNWLQRAGGAGVLCRVDADMAIAAVLGLGCRGGMPRAIGQHLGAIHGYLSVAMSGTRMVEAERHNVERLQELGMRLAATNESLREACQSRNLLLASMSHELRTPLNAIIGLAELLGDGAVGEVSEQQRTYLGVIESSGKHLLKLVEDLLEIAATDTGYLRLRPEPCVVAQVLAEAVQELEPLARQRRITVESSLPPDSAVLVTDPSRLRQVAANLVSNAVKFSPEGGTVEVVAECDGERLTLVVRDQGPGIAEADQRAIFEEFRRAPGAPQVGIGGSGLGLPLAKRIVEAQGGSIEVRSVPGEGSEFIVRLPETQAAPRTEPEAEAAPLPGSPEPEEGLPVAVVVERDGPSRALLCRAAARAGFRPVEVAPSDLIPSLEQMQVAVVLFGQSRGGNAPDEALCAMRGDRRWWDMPVVFVGDRPLQDRALELGVTDAVGYPVDQERLASVVRAAAARQATRSQGLALIIDDNPTFAEALGLILQGRGLRTLIARNGSEGLDLARRYNPDVILLDLLLPVRSGWQVLTALEEDAATKAIPVVVMTVKPLTADERSDLESRVATVLPKVTFEPERIWEVLGRLGVLGSWEGVEGGRPEA